MANQAGEQAGFRIRVVAEAGTCPVTKQALPLLEEIVTVPGAISWDDARKKAMVYMTIRPRGQMLRTYNAETDEELLGDF